MKIIKLVAENFKGLKAIEIVPDEHFQIVSGKNAQGKSSVLDSIWAAIAGKNGMKETDKPIRDGEKNASVSVEMGGLTVVRRWNGDKSTLEVTAKDGAKYSSPQTMLDGLIGKLSFDPLSFANQEEKKQKATLQDLVGINFDKLDTDRKGHYEERTLHNRAAEKLKGALSELPFPKEGTPTEEVSASDIIKELSAAQDVIRENEVKRRQLEQAREAAAVLKSSITELKAQLADKEDRYNETVRDGKELSALIETLVNPDTTAIQSKLENVEATNKSVSQAAQYRRLEGEIKEYSDSSDWCTDKIKDIDQLKSEMLQGATFPIAGLSFDENGVTFNGIPFKQCSAAERLKVSMAMAMSLNPELRVIRILDGSLLDSDNLKLIHEMAKEKDYQVWLELVDESGNMGVMIEDGQVKELAVNGAI